MSNWFGPLKLKRKRNKGSMKKPLFEETGGTQAELRDALELLDLENPVTFIELFRCLGDPWRTGYREYVRHGRVPVVSYMEAAMKEAQCRLGL